MKEETPKNLDKIISLLKKEVKKFKIPIATKIGNKTRDPFRVLISCILSLRTKDTTTGPACERLFKAASNPQDILRLSNKRIEKLIFPVGFYPTKTRYIKRTCKILIEDYNSEVPDTMNELLKLPGIGRKCAGLTLIYGHKLKLILHIFFLYRAILITHSLYLELHCYSPQLKSCRFS